MKRFAAAAALLLMVGIAASSSEEDRIRIIHADEVVYDGSSHTIDMSGNVEIVRGGLTVSADGINLVLDEEETRIESGTADGNVEISDGGRRATARHAEFAEAERNVVLTGDPHLWDGPNEILADRIVYNANTRRMRATGNVRGSFFPPEEGD